MRSEVLGEWNKQGPIGCHGVRSLDLERLAHSRPRSGEMEMNRYDLHLLAEPTQVHDLVTDDERRTDDAVTGQPHIVS